MMGSCLVLGIPAVAFMISVLHCRATDLMAFSIAASTYLPLPAEQPPVGDDAADNEQYPIKV
ncbi:hypothetical protein, partial [Yersinia nurmii]|uniref:hypothetical protein n=1 Tax=Yersinia nurmii TaxID=685706 RepID=UPI001ADF16B7